VKIYGPSAAGVGNHGCRLYKAADQSIPTSANTFIAFDSARWDTDGYASYPAAEVPVGQDGVYLITLHCYWALNVAGYRKLWASVYDGATHYLVESEVEPTIAGDAGSMSVSTIMYLGVGNRVAGWVYQTTGGNLNLISDAAASIHSRSVELSIQKIANL
jgi:hypothetical protein